MGFTEGYNSLYSMVRNNYPNITQYLNLALYEILRLYSVGYIHGDISLANIMINTSYNYTGSNSGRAMLIDFGMTFKHEYTDREIPVILDRLLNTATPFSGITPMQHANYNWFVNYIFTSSTEIITETIKRLNKSITDHNQKMIDMINNTYPAVLANIRMYNDTKQHNNIFNGGFVDALLPDVEHSIKNNMIAIKSGQSMSTLEKIQYKTRPFAPQRKNLS